jgi:hypothetical protein
MLSLALPMAVFTLQNHFWPARQMIYSLARFTPCMTLCLADLPFSYQLDNFFTCQIYFLHDTLPYRSTICSSHDSSPCRSSCRPSVFCNRIYKDSPFSAAKILLLSFQAPLKRKDPPSKPLLIYIYIKENHTHGSRKARVLSSRLKLRTQEHVLSSGLIFRSFLTFS